MKLPPFIYNNLYALVAIAGLVGVMTSVYHNARLAAESRKEEIKIRHSGVDLEYELHLVTSRMDHLRRQVDLISRENNVQVNAAGTSVTVKGNLPANHALYQLTGQLAEYEDQVAFIKHKIRQNQQLLEACSSGRDFGIVIIELSSLFSYLVLYVFVRSRDFKMRH
jgi:hypothetical protein